MSGKVNLRSAGGIGEAASSRRQSPGAGRRCSGARVSPRWRWWPYALPQLILILVLFLPASIPFLDTALAGAFILFTRVRHGIREWGAWLLLAAAIVLAGRAGDLEGMVRAAGFAAVLVLGFQASRPGAPAATRHRAHEAAGLCLAVPLIGFALLAVRDIHLQTYDPVLARIDSMGPPLAWDLARAASAHALFRVICYGAYSALPLAIVVVAEVERPRTARARSIFAAAALAGVVGFVAYQAVPATGPIYAFPGYPAERPLEGSFSLAVPVQASLPRNAMPSLHVTWALLVAWHAARVGVVAGVVGSAFLILTMVATLARGEHYLIDLVLAVPLAVGVAAALASRPRMATAAFLITAAGLAAIALTV